MKLLLAPVLIGVLTIVASGGEARLAWPQFRGPGGTGIADDQKPPIEFGPAKNVKWKVAAPSGFSSQVIVADKLVITAYDAGKLFTIAYDRSDGKELWRAEAPAKQIEPHHKTEGSPAASTPVTDGKRIVVYFGSCGLFCYDLCGTELWKYELPVAATPCDFGSGVSPIMADGVVILVRDENANSRILVLDAVSGKLRWEKRRESTCSFCTPVTCDTPDGKQVVAAGYQRMIGYDLMTGDEKWYVSGMPAVACASPVFAAGAIYFAGWSPGEDVKLPSFDVLLKEAAQVELGYITQEGLDKTFMKGMFDSQDFDHDGELTRAEWDRALRFLSASKNSAFALKLGGAGDVTASHVLWKKTKGLPYVPTGIVYRGQYILLKDGGIITAYDASSGKELYMRRAGVAQRYYASPVAANGCVYFTSLESGVVTVLRVDGAEPEVVAKNAELRERVAATPAIAEDTLYIRTASHLYAFAEDE